MDTQRIDQLSRLLASGRSRRSVVKAITGAFFGAAAFSRFTPRADAQAVCAAVDESCAEIECCDGLTCSGNICFDASCGVADDACEINDDCCNGFACAGGTCIDASCGVADDACEINDDCCFGFVCAGNTCIDASCGDVGDTCEIHDDCCFGFGCFENACIDVTDCGFVGETCEISDDCCFGYVCESNACISYTCNSAGQSCETDNCCDGLTCSDDLVCSVPDDDVTPTPTIPVTTLPSTGSGSGNVGTDASWLGVVGAAAAIGGVLITRKKASEETTK